MNQYTDRLKSVMTYIEEHIERPIDLEELAKIANFSKYHFSRVFTSVTGKTPLGYVTQRRLHKAIAYLSETTKPILEISMLCGFESASSFNLAFKKHFNKTPSEVRKTLRSNSNISLSIGNMNEEILMPSSHPENSKNNFLRRIWEMNIAVKELREFEVAFVRHVGSYLDTGEAWGKLNHWATEHKLFPGEQQFIGISLDDPNTTDEYACRYDACVTIPHDFDKQDHPDIQYTTLPGGRYAIYKFYDTIDKLGIAYQSVFGQWLPSSGFDPDERYCLEFVMNDPWEDPEGKCRVDLYIPIKYGV